MGYKSIISICSRSKHLKEDVLASEKRNKLHWGGGKWWISPTWVNLGAYVNLNLLSSLAESQFLVKNNRFKLKLCSPPKVKECWCGDPSYVLVFLYQLYPFNLFHCRKVLLKQTAKHVFTASEKEFKFLNQKYWQTDTTDTNLL